VRKRRRECECTSCTEGKSAVLQIECRIDLTRVKSEYLDVQRGPYTLIDTLRRLEAVIVRKGGVNKPSDSRMSDYE
jgi:hypothetical protein